MFHGRNVSNRINQTFWKSILFNLLFYENSNLYAFKVRVQSLISIDRSAERADVIFLHIRRKKIWHLVFDGSLMGIEEQILYNVPISITVE